MRWRIASLTILCEQYGVSNIWQLLQSVDKVHKSREIVRFTVKYCSASSWSFNSFSCPPASCFSLEQDQQSVNRFSWPNNHQSQNTFFKSDMMNEILYYRTVLQQTQPHCTVCSICIVLMMLLCI